MPISFTCIAFDLLIIPCDTLTTTSSSCNLDDGMEELISVKVNRNLIDECLFSSNHEGVKFSNLNMRYSGCAALDLAYVASGRLDGFFHNKINIWDVAAGALLVKEAGGIVNGLDKFDQNNIDIRASSGAINDKMLENLKNF